MKKFFIFNPIAGQGKAGRAFLQSLEEVMKTDPSIHLYVTKGVGDATTFADKIATKYKEDIYIYACGGDGTTYEVINGIADHDNVYVGIVPTGSCNDFLKSYTDYDFLDLNKQLNAKVKKIDLLRVNGHYCLNEANIGFDARVNYDQIQLRKKCKSIKQAYNRAIIKNLLIPLSEPMKVVCDGKEFYNANSTLIAICNGNYYGGGFKVAPYAKDNDGILDVVLVKKLFVLSFAMLIKKFRAGLHLADKKCMKHIKYTTCKEVTISADHQLCLTIDGETFHTDTVNIKVLPDKIRFLLPEK